jgi:hypothetical protein
MRDCNAHTDGNTSGYSDANVNSNSYGHRYIHPDGDGHSYRYSYSDGDVRAIRGQPDRWQHCARDDRHRQSRG